MVTYQFEIDDEVWEEWKGTLSKSDTIENEIIRLIESDIDG